MPDYIYLLENRLSADQQHALRQLREAAHEAGMILFLTGDAVRDLTSGHAVRDLEVSVHGDALKLKKPIEKLGASIWGESDASRTLYLCFPGTVRVDVVSTHRLDHAKLGRPVYHAASIQEDLRRRDFTVNAMAISLNEGSFGLLMDPLNGAADIEARTLRLVSNYGFLEDPSVLIRATRYIARLGWELDPKTQTRYENAKGEGVIDQLSAEARSRELEQIGLEDDGLKILRALEAEGWMQALDPAWTSAKADEERLKALHDLSVELLLQGVRADMAAAQMQLLTAKLAAKDLAALKKLLLRPGFVEEWDSLDSMAAKFAKVLLSKENSTASAGFKLFTSYDPEAVLWLGFTSKDKAVQERYNLFLKVWPEARQRIPHALMQEMRITPELATYKEIVQSLFLELIDGRLTTTEELRAFLEPHSPPAPPPQVTVKRPRAKRGEAKVKERAYDDEDEDSEDAADDDEDLDDLGGDDDDIDLGLNLPKVDLEPEPGEFSEPESVEDDLDGDDLDSDTDPPPPPPKKGGKPPTPSKAGKDASGSSAAVKPHAAEKHPPAHPAKASAPPVEKNAQASENKRDDKVSKAAPVSPAAKPHQIHAPAPKPAAKPQAPAAKAHPAKPAPAKAAPAKAALVKAKASAAKPAKGKVHLKVAPVKAKPASKPAPKPVKKAVAPVKSAKPAAKKAKKR
jgi:tRNA nucleotidyltransferase (CCA-adding enzyme)